MAIKFKVNCTACTMIRTEAGTKSPQSSKLYKLIDQHHLGSMTIQDIADMYKDRGLSYVSIRNHGIKHQNISEKKLMDARVKAVQGKKVAQLIVAGTDKQQFLDEVIAQVREGLATGELTSSVKDGLQATKISLDQESREKDRGLKVMEMITAFASGELKQSAPKVVEGELSE